MFVVILPLFDTCFDSMMTNVNDDDSTTQMAVQAK